MGAEGSCPFQEKQHQFIRLKQIGNHSFSQTQTWLFCHRRKETLCFFCNSHIIWFFIFLRNLFSSQKNLSSSVTARHLRCRRYFLQSFSVPFILAYFPQEIPSCYRISHPCEIKCLVAEGKKVEHRLFSHDTFPFQTQVWVFSVVDC